MVQNAFHGSASQKQLMDGHTIIYVYKVVIFRLIKHACFGPGWKNVELGSRSRYLIWKFPEFDPVMQGYVKRRQWNITVILWHCTGLSENSLFPSIVFSVVCSGTPADMAILRHLIKLILDRYLSFSRHFVLTWHFVQSSVEWAVPRLLQSNVPDLISLLHHGFRLKDWNLMRWEDLIPAKSDLVFTVKFPCVRSTEGTGTCARWFSCMVSL